MLKVLPNAGFTRPPEDKERTRELRRMLADHLGRYRAVVLATIIAFCLSAWLTAKGIFDKAVEAGVADTQGMVTAVMSSAVAAALLGPGQIVLFGVAMSAVRRQVWQIAVLAFLLMPFVVGISTVNAVNGNAARPSLVYDMRDSAKSHASYYEAMSLDASGAQSAEALLLPLQTSVCDMADREGQDGIITGSGGAGAVSAAYRSSCTNIETIVETLGETVQRTNARRDEAAALLDDLTNIPDDKKLSVFERQAAFRLKAGELRNLIEASGSENVAKRLHGQLQILEATVVTLGVKDGGYGEKQAGAVANLKESLGQVSKIVSGLLVGSAANTPEPPADLMDMSAAVIAYWRLNIPQILLAVMVGFMALWFAGLLVVSRSTLDARRDALSV